MLARVLREARKLRLAQVAPDEERTRQLVAEVAVDRPLGDGRLASDDRRERGDGVADVPGRRLALALRLEVLGVHHDVERAAVDGE